MKTKRPKSEEPSGELEKITHNPPSLAVVELPTGCPQPIVFTVPVRTESMSNARLHWALKAKKVKAQRAATAYRTPLELKTLGPLLTVTLTRVSPRQLDDDNLRGALKGIRDQVACALGVDDRSSLVCWGYGQEKGEDSVRIEVATP